MLHCTWWRKVYTWRHDNILLYIVETIQKGVNELEESVQITSDLNISPCMVQNWNINYPYPMYSNLPHPWYHAPIGRISKNSLFIELSVPFETNTEKAHNYKESKYAHLIIDLESKGFTVKYFAIEIGSRGHITPQNKTRLNLILTEFGKPVPLKDFRNTLLEKSAT